MPMAKAIRISNKNSKYIYDVGNEGISIFNNTRASRVHMHLHVTKDVWYTYTYVYNAPSTHT